MFSLSFAEALENPNKPSKINFIRTEIPDCDVGKYEGSHYEGMVPDTLDLAEMARLCINALTEATDPEWEDELYWRIEMYRNPPVMWHSFSDWCQLKYMEALPFLRMMTDSRQNLDVDKVWKDVLLKSIGPDGLYYVPMFQHPFVREEVTDDDPWFGHIWQPDGSWKKIKDPENRFLAHPYTIGRSTSVMLSYFLRDGNSLWLDLARRQIDRARELLIDKGDYGYYPSGHFAPDAHPAPDAQMPMHGQETGGRITQGAVQLYRLAGYKPALELAGKLVHYTRHISQNFDDEGRFLVEPEIADDWAKHNNGDRIQYGGHFHNHTLMLQSILEYALAANDRELIDFTTRSFDWAKTQGSGTIGFFPEFIVPDHVGSPQPRISSCACETCEIADMLAIGAKLSEAGIDRWEDVERWTRNHFSESQLRRCDWIYRMGDQMPLKPVEFNMTADRMPERNLGCFAGWSAANDWVTRFGVQQCCTGNAARSLFYLWQRMLDCKDGQLRIHMLMNRASRWVDILSHVPYRGQVDLKVKEPLRSIRVHAPEWIPTGSTDISATVNGKACAISWSKRYVDLGEAQAGDKVSVVFPINEKQTNERIGGIDYTLVLRGNTVVQIDPLGKFGRLYERDYLRDTETRWRTVDRFIYEKDLPLY
jgi:hypothetical protein